MGTEPEDIAKQATTPEERPEDVDARLKAESLALIAELEALIRRAKILQLEHKAIVSERKQLKKTDK